MTILVIPERFGDHRGFFGEIYNRRRYENLGINIDFVQDNHSVSRSIGTLRGLHFQAAPHAQAKLVRCGRGAIFDVAVDIRCGSPTYGKWEGYELTAETGHQLYVPVGFAHGFIALSDISIFSYKVDNFYNKLYEKSIFYDDSFLNINWKVNENDLIISQKDKPQNIL